MKKTRQTKTKIKLGIAMTPQDFNQSTLVPRYSYARSPVNARAFLILERDDILAEGRPVGDFTVLDREEDLTLAEKKVMNLVSLMNGRKSKVIPLGEETRSRMFYKVLSQRDEDNKSSIMFYTQKNDGVSKESALFRIGSDHVHA